MTMPTVDNAGVVVCGECGEPLELHCKHGHDPLPIGIKPIRPKSKRTYTPKMCACGATFIPTGPHAKRCDACKAAPT